MLNAKQYALILIGTACLFGCFSAVALPGHKAAVIRLSPSGYEARMTFWEGLDGKIYGGGTILITVTNDHGELIEDKIGMNIGDFDDNILSAPGKNYLILVSQGKMLADLGGPQGFIGMLEQLTDSSLEPFLAKEGDDCMVALFDNKTNKLAVSSGKANITLP